MKQWEYKEVVVSSVTGRPDWKYEANKLGQAGWELVSKHDDYPVGKQIGLGAVAYTVTLTFKRQIEVGGVGMDT